MGIVTADTVGCNLLCAYCWNYYKNLKPEKHEEYYTPRQVSEKLLRVSRARNCNLFRISGAEPILGVRSAKHLSQVITTVRGEIILETNGLMIGYEPKIAELLRIPNLVVRVTIKGWDEESFERITGARGEFFKYQLKALETLAEAEIPFWIAVMHDIFGEEGLRALKRMLPVQCRIEHEFLEAYPFILDNMKKRNIPIR